MENENKKCPFCDAEIPISAKKCKCCGEWLSDFPEELRRFNWGAFLLNWIWGIMHKQYITLLYFVACIVPVIGPLAISIWFGIMGNKWAWNSKSWDSVEQFNEVQTSWVRLWFVLAILSLIITLKVILFVIIVSNIEV